MRAIGIPASNLAIEQPPDTVMTLLMANSVAQSMNWVSTAVKTQFARVSAFTTAGAAMAAVANLQTTAAALSSGLTTGSSAANCAINGNRFLQVPGGSTGFSVITPTSGWVMVETWSRSGST